jgi:DNA-binding CsgD family transcriptional regulator
MFGRDLYGERCPTEREYRIIALVAQGLNNRDIAREVGTTQNVLKNRLRAIYDKLGMWHRVELALWYEARGSDGRANAYRRTGAGHFSLGAVNACEARRLRRNLDVPDENI